MDTNIPQIVTAIFVVAGPVTLWFGIGSKLAQLMGKVDTLSMKVNGNQKLAEEQIGEIVRQIARQATTQEKSTTDFELRLRTLEGRERGGITKATT